ncbi:MAG TPA: hypothetical protein V6D09_08245 [Leptolyngbyaceae cyanobacterium]
MNVWVSPTPRIPWGTLSTNPEGNVNQQSIATITHNVFYLVVILTSLDFL